MIHNLCMKWGVYWTHTQLYLGLIPGSAWGSNQGWLPARHCLLYYLSGPMIGFISYKLLFWVLFSLLFWGHTQWYWGVSPGSAFRNYSWWCLEDHIGWWGSNLGHLQMPYPLLLRRSLF